MTAISDIQGPFDLSDMFERQARRALFHVPPLYTLASEVAVSVSLDEGKCTYDLGLTSEVGNIGKTRAFRDFSAEVVAAIPEVKDLSFRTTSDHRLGASHALVDIRFHQQPSLMTKIGRAIKRNI